MHPSLASARWCEASCRVGRWFEDRSNSKALTTGIAQQRQIGHNEAGILRVEGMHRHVELVQPVAYRRHRPISPSL
jgi:hypothetical protein